jgi:hypothetical protein
MVTNTQVDLPSPAGLSEREFDFLTRVTMIATWVSRHDDEEVIARCMSELGMDRPTADAWLTKAQEYMALGAVENVEAARQLYLCRLESIYQLSMSRAVRDEVKVTTRPMKLQVGDSDETREVMGTTTEVKPQAFNAAAVQLALKAATDAAKLQGAKSEGGGTRIGNMNVLMQGNGGELPMGNTVDQLSDQDLAKLIGVEVAEAERRVPRLDAAPSNGEHTGD